MPRPTGGNIVSQADVSGNRLPRAPRWTFNIAPSLDVPLASGMLNINGTLFRSSVVYFDFLNSVKQDPYTAINSEISWRTDDEKFRSEEHTSELQSLMSISYAVFCLKKT